ncbi:hypothetical protein C0991_006518 [Blastosporella zonata]|nr:hypothetical protein C0991_006518 [Blastosporella zonata]
MSTQAGTDAPPVYSRAGSPTGSSTSDFEAYIDDTAPRYSDAPRYSVVFALNGRPIRGTRASHPLTTEHSFSLEKNGASWVKLSFTSRASSTSSDPRFEGGDHIIGSLVLDLDSPTSITEITISVKGSLTTAGTEGESHVFLNKSYNVWSKAMGNPRYASSTQNVKHRGNLDSGVYTWPLLIPFPANFDYSDGLTAKKSYRTPQSFLERGAPATVQYELLLRIGRGVLRADKK